MNKIYLDKKSIKEDFYASVYDNIDEIKGDISDLTFQQDLNKGKTDRNKRTDKTIDNIRRLIDK